jgi:hypothetical protein
LVIYQNEITEKVQVYHFHDGCGEQLKTYHVEVQEDSGEKSVPIWGRQVSTVIDAVEKEEIPRAQYGALLIDPEKDSLLLLYDDAQSIYKKQRDKKKDRLDFSHSSVGIQARGRTTVLKMNYRNTRQILSFAYNFSKDFIQERQSDEDAIPRIAPEMAGQEGIEPVVKVWGSLTELKDIAVVYTSKAVGDSVEKVTSIKANVSSGYGY